MKNNNQEQSSQSETSVKTVEELFLKQIQSVQDSSVLNEIRIHFLGKKGLITKIVQTMASMPLSEKKLLGEQIHPLKKKIQNLLALKENELQTKSENLKLLSEKIDPTLPGSSYYLGSLHPISKMLHRITDIFSSLGFSCETGPEVESQYYNFDALNIPKHHPARTTADTFFILNSQNVLRTQTSGVQIRTMEKSTPPISIISPGLCFRKDEVDATHLPLFHQVEGLFIDKNVSFADLKGVLEYFAQSLFGSETKVRFRPDFFPFTEPSAEVAFSCVACKGKSSHCGVCKGTGFIEVAGCGMVHPTVLKNGNIDPKTYSGYAFGFGIERLTMIYFGITDIRLLYSNTNAFLSQFSRPLF